MDLWKEIEKEFHIKFLKEDGTFRPVNEWLDDIYLTFLPLQLEQLLRCIMDHGDILFQDLLSHEE